MAEGNCRWVCKVLSVMYVGVFVCVCVCVCGVWFCVYVHNNVTSSDMTACLFPLLFLTEQV